MYKIFKVDLNNTTADVNLPEGFSIEGTLFTSNESVVLLLFKPDPPATPEYYGALSRAFEEVNRVGGTSGVSGYATTTGISPTLGVINDAISISSPDYAVADSAVTTTSTARSYPWSR